MKNKERDVLSRDGMWRSVAEEQQTTTAVAAATSTADISVYRRLSVVTTVGHRRSVRRFTLSWLTATKEQSSRHFVIARRLYYTGKAR